MPTKKFLRTLLILGMIALNIGCDQLSKSIVRDKILPGENINLLHGHFLITKVENTGAFLSIGDDIQGPLRVLFLSVFPAVLLIISISYLIRNKHIQAFTLLGICFIIGGGIGNIYDRVVHGSVTDFLYLDYQPFHTGVFNLADVSISVGAVLVLIGMNIKNPPGFLKHRSRARLSRSE